MTKNELEAFKNYTVKTFTDVDNRLTVDEFIDKFRTDNDFAEKWSVEVREYTTYRNRYGAYHTFTKLEDGNVLWEGDFEFHRYGWPNNPDGTTNYDIIDMVDPSGGPYIEAGKMLSHIVYGDDLNVIVESFERVDTGYIIKCKEHEYDPNDMSHLADSKIIGGIINTTEPEMLGSTPPPPGIPPTSEYIDRL